MADTNVQWSAAAGWRVLLLVVVSSASVLNSHRARPHPLEKTMNFHHTPRTHLLVLHPDPILCAGLLAALRQHPGFEVFVHGGETPGTEQNRVDVVLAD